MRASGGYYGRAVREMNNMGIRIAIALYVLVMVATIVGVDVAFFRSRSLERLMVNVGLVLVFGAFYLRFFRHP
jgi:hypothetical protein